MLPSVPVVRGRMVLAGTLAVALFATALIALIVYLFDLAPRGRLSASAHARAKRRRAGRVAIVTNYGGDREMERLTGSNKAAYAQRHGYDLIQEVGDKESPIAEKYRMLAAALAEGQKYDAVVWIDGDVLYLNQEATYEALLERSPSAVIAARVGGSPAASAPLMSSIIFRSTPAALRLVRKLAALSDAHCGDYILNNGMEPNDMQSPWIAFCNSDGSFTLDDAGMLVAVLRTSSDTELAAQIAFVPQGDAFIGAFPRYANDTLSVSFGGGLSRHTARRLIKALTHFAPPGGGWCGGATDILDPIAVLR